MGEAKRKMLHAVEIVTFHFEAPDYLISKANLESLGKRAGKEATKILIGAIVGAAYPQGMDRPTGKQWAVWLEVIEEDASSTEVSRGNIQWLRDLAADEDLKIQPALAQWREVFVDYLDELLNRPKEKRLNEDDREIARVE